MQVTAEQTNPCTIVLNIDVDEQQVSRTFDQVYREFSKFANIRGFRPGKAPRSLVERNVNQEKVRERALEKLVSETYYKAIEEEDITPYRQAQIVPTDIEDKKPYTFQVIVPLEPKITLGEYIGLTVEKPIFKISDEMVTERIDRAREERARLERVTDRGVQEGDVLIAEKSEKLEGEDGEEAAPRRQLIQLGDNPPGFDEAIMGMTIGEERTFDITYPEDDEIETRRGKKSTFTVKLSSISAKRVPELNDEFAKAVAGLDTVDELLASVREQMEQEVNNYSEQVAEQRLFQEILNNSEIFFPDVLVREEVEDDLRQLGQSLRQSNVSYEQFLQMRQWTAEQHQQQLANEAAQQIRTLLALREISIQEDLQATDEQVDAEFDRLLTDGTLTDEQYEEYQADPRRRLQLANALIQQRLHDFLFANNTINEVEQATPPNEAEVAEANADVEDEDAAEEEQE